MLVVSPPTHQWPPVLGALRTHKGCTVAKVEGGAIVCPCHASRFSIEDGSRQAGPAQSPLASKKVSVEGDQISIS